MMSYGPYGATDIYSMIAECIVEHGPRTISEMDASIPELDYRTIRQAVFRMKGGSLYVIREDPNRYGLIRLPKGVRS